MSLERELFQQTKDLERGFISREDVAKTVIASLDEKNTENRAFDLTEGDTPIAEALKKL
nr:hypothetical protein [Bacillus subtilis]